MKFLKGLLYSILILLSLISLFIIICAFQPNLSDKVAGLFQNKLGNGTSPYGEDMAQEDMLPMPEGSGAADGIADSIADSIADGIAVGSDDAAVHGGTGNATGSDNGENGTLENLLGEDINSGYVPPEREAVNVPESVTGRGGYTPVQEVAEQIDEEEAKELQKKYTYGETGEDLSFDTEYYPYYGMLPEKLQSLYRQIYANAMAVNGIFNPIEKVNQTELRHTFMAVFNDHPELFWLDSAYRAKFARNGECAEIALEFNYLVDNLDEAKGEFQSGAESILSGARNLGSDYEKELYVHNALLDRITYDMGAPLNQSAYSALVGGRTVCAGYARSFQYLMTELGIPCYYCTGYAGESHAWNIIRLDGEYYNADATWDDTNPDKYGYFNKTDSEFSTTHRREDLSVYLPACNGTKYSNLEDSTQESSPEQAQPQYVDERRSLNEIGFSEKDVLRSLQEYYDDCYRQLTTAGDFIEFVNIVDSEDLWMECYRAYESDNYSFGYMDRVLEELGAGGCEVDVEAESLQDGRVLLYHTITFF